MSKKKIINKPPLTPVIILSIMIVIAAIGIYRAGIYTDTNTPQTANTNPNNDNWKKITNERVLFFTKIFLDRSKTYISFPIKFDQRPLMSWLTLIASESAQPEEFLVTLPAFDNLDWSDLSEGTIHLYQRNKTYKSLAAFIQNPPPPNRVAIDPAIHNLPRYKNIQGYNVDNNLSLESVDYILTTYNKTQYNNGVYYYENIIDASPGTVNSNSNLTWQLVVPQASSTSAFYLGQIHVDYNRNQ